jgi:hypothetical protein
MHRLMPSVLMGLIMPFPFLRSASIFWFLYRHAIVNPLSLRPHLHISHPAVSQATILHEHAHSLSDRKPSSPAFLSVHFLLLGTLHPLQVQTSKMPVQLPL